MRDELYFCLQDSRRTALRDELIALRAEEKLLDEWERQRQADLEATRGKKSQ